ncbi:MAG: META domain-containing protein [Myxococcales bacterium FL481]|nr:MAG: META domain-containing protein [Myxococcales bacterium FL481]
MADFTHPVSHSRRPHRPAPRRLRFAAAATLLCAIAGPACDHEDPDSPLLDRRFLAQSVLIGGEPHELVPNTNLSLAFSEADAEFGGDGWLSAHAGCNSFGAGYSLRGDTLVLRGGVSTTAGCDQPLGMQEDWYFDLLRARPRLELDGNQLVLETADTRIEYLDKEVANPDRELVGPVWEVHSVVEGEVAWGASWDEPATFVFSEDGTVEVFGGCNWASGRYSGDGGTLRFTDVVSTDLWCNDEAGRLEDAVFVILQDNLSVHWEIDDVRLALDAGDRGLRLSVRDE